MHQRNILRHARELQQATSLGDLLEITERTVRDITRYRHSWLGLFDDDDTTVRMVTTSPDIRNKSLDGYPKVPVAGDQMIEEIRRARHVVVVVDARTDPRTNKGSVERFAARTIVNVPLIVGERLIGGLGCGTLGDEVLEPTQTETDALTVYAVQLAAAFDRVHNADRQRQIENEKHRLVQQLEALERVELMGVLASGVAHDLNNLLSVILSNLETLDVLRLGGEASAVSDAIEAAHRSRDVVKQLLALGRSEGTKRERVDVNEHVRSTLALVRTSVPRTVEMRHETSGAAVVDADPVQLDQALTNLIINARDAVGQVGSIVVNVDDVHLDEVAVRDTPWARPGRFKRIAVKDSGPGIAPEIVARIFDPLFTTKPNGTGLGLAVVSRVVKQHEGVLRCTSTPGEGTTFEVCLPSVSS